MHHAKVNDKIFEIVPAEDGLLINDKPFQWDLVKITDGYFHILYQFKSYRAEIVSTDATTKTSVIKINGHSYTVALKDKFDLLLEKMGMNAAAGSKINNIKAPMPGLIIDLKVKTGDSVKAGDHLVILEAMKMENIIKSPGEGTVKNVKVKKGDSVEKGQVLVEF
jgi:biotin carboxyl carrier protein